jgi:hypothetical protein
MLLMQLMEMSSRLQQYVWNRASFWPILVTHFLPPGCQHNGSGIATVRVQFSFFLHLKPFFADHPVTTWCIRWNHSNTWTSSASTYRYRRGASSSSIGHLAVFCCWDQCCQGQVRRSDPSGSWPRVRQGVRRVAGFQGVGEGSVNFG